MPRMEIANLCCFSYGLKSKILRGVHAPSATWSQVPIYVTSLLQVSCSLKTIGTTGKPKMATGNVCTGDIK